MRKANAPHAKARHEELHGSRCCIKLQHPGNEGLGTALLYEACAFRLSARLREAAGRRTGEAGRPPAGPRRNAPKGGFRPIRCSQSKFNPCRRKYSA